MAWGDKILPGLRPGVKVYLSSGRFVGVEDGGALFAVPDQGLLKRAEPLIGEVESAVAAHFGRQVPLRLVLDTGARPNRTGGTAERASGSGGPGSGSTSVDADPQHEDVDHVDIGELQDAPGAAMTPEQRLLEAFPGAEEVTQ